MRQVVKQAFLVGVLGAVGGAALLGAGMVVMPGYLSGALVDNVLATMLVIALTSLLCLAVSIPLEKKRVVVLAWAVMVMAGLMGMVWVASIWFQRELWSLFDPTGTSPWRGEEIVWRLNMTVVVPAACLVLGALFMMLRVRRVVRWLQAGTAALLGVAAVSGLGLLWWDGHGQELDRMFWSLVVVTWAGATGTLVLGRLYPATGENLAARGMRVVCPQCLLEQEMTAGEGRCEQCKMKFKIWVEGGGQC